MGKGAAEIPASNSKGSSKDNSNRNYCPDQVTYFKHLGLLMDKLFEDGTNIKIRNRTVIMKSRKRFRGKFFGSLEYQNILK